MDTRYQHLQVAELYGPAWTYDAWWRIEQAVARAQRAQISLDPDKKEQYDEMAEIDDPEGVVDFTRPKSVAAVRAIELETGHDVVAFLNYVRLAIGRSGRWIHFGLTSSDLVDTAQAMRFKLLGDTAETLMVLLQQGVRDWTKDTRMVLGRTHGEPAEPISMGMRATHWLRMLESAGDRLVEAGCYMEFAKTSGPVGNYAHNGPWIESKVATELGLASHGPGASQIIPRVNLANWATCVSQVISVCAKITMDMRLMVLLGEGYFEREDRVGSSSMAHKKNPIRAEKITGLQRVAAGYAGMLQPLDLWLERDISNSSVERIAVPDLWHLLFHVVTETTVLLRTFGLSASDSIGRAGHKPMVHRATLEHIREGMTVEEAREAARFGPQPLEMSELQWRQYTDYSWFTRNWPSGGDQE